jgi:hypothetical protein
VQVCVAGSGLDKSTDTIIINYLSKLQYILVIHNTYIYVKYLFVHFKLYDILFLIIT